MVLPLGHHTPDECLGAFVRTELLSRRRRPSYKRPGQPSALVEQTSRLSLELAVIIYLIDHDRLVEPKSTAGFFRSDSWPLFGGMRDQPPTEAGGSNLVDFRYSNRANALFVDGSVRFFRFEDLVNTKLKYLMPPDQ